MLNDLKVLALRDAHDMLGAAARQTKQLKTTFEPIAEFDRVQNVVFAGMGGSALCAELAKKLPGTTQPFEIVRSYELPGYVDGNTLFIAASHSGNTAETLAMFDQAKAAGAQIVAISSGGELKRRAEQSGYRFVQLEPNNQHPRLAVFEGWAAVMHALSAAGVLNQASNLADAYDFVSLATQDWREDVPISKNLAKQIAQELMGRSVVVYTGPQLSPLGQKWKLALNETAKNVAWSNTYPEMNHNEFVGWTSHPVDKLYAIVNLRSADEDPRIMHRFEESDRLLSGRRPHPITIDVQGGTQLEQMEWGVVLADYVSIYLALLNNVDPSPVKIVDTLKQALNKRAEGL